MQIFKGQWSNTFVIILSFYGVQSTASGVWSVIQNFRISCIPYVHTHSQHTITQTYTESTHMVVDEPGDSEARGKLYTQHNDSNNLHY